MGAKTKQKSIKKWSQHGKASWIPFWKPFWSLFWSQNPNKIARRAAKTDFGPTQEAREGEEKGVQKWAQNGIDKKRLEVEKRTGPGINKLGGTARVMAVHATDRGVCTYDVKYITEGGHEKGGDSRCHNARYRVPSPLPHLHPPITSSTNASPLPTPAKVIIPYPVS